MQIPSPPLHPDHTRHLGYPAEAPVPFWELKILGVSSPSATGAYIPLADDEIFVLVLVVLV